MPRVLGERSAAPRLAGALALALLVLALRAATAATAPIPFADGLTSPSEPPAIQQFTAGGHVLGFQPGGLVLSNGRYALGVSFDGAAPVAPTSDDPSAVADPGQPGSAAAAGPSSSGAPDPRRSPT